MDAQREDNKPKEMSDPENFEVVRSTQKHIVSARRRMQNRIAQQKFRERQKSNTQKNTTQSVIAALDCLGPSNTADVGGVENTFDRDETALLASTEHLASSSSQVRCAPYQWHSPSLTRRTSFSQLPPNLGLMLESDTVLNASTSDLSWEELLSPTEAESHRCYFPHRMASPPDTNNISWFEPPKFVLSERVAFSEANTPSTTLPHMSPWSSTGDSSASSTSSMDQPFCAETSAHNNPLTNTPLLHVAVQTRKKTMVRLLLRRGVADIDGQDVNGRTALHIATQSGDVEIVQTLLKHGANPKTLDRQGLDALRCAVVEGHEEVVESLLDALGSESMNQPTTSGL